MVSTVVHHAQNDVGLGAATAAPGVLLEQYAPSKMMEQKMKNTIPVRDRHSVTIAIASEFTGVSKTRIYEFIRDGHIESRKIHGRRLVIVQSLIDYLDQDRAAT
jgi:hypothetical protein